MVSLPEIDTYLATQAHEPLPVLPSSGKDIRAMEKAAADFEAVFIRQIMKELVPKEGAFFGSGPGAQMFQSMFVDTLANQVATEGGFGIKELLEREYLEKWDSDGQKPIDVVSGVKPRSKVTDQLV